MTTKDPIHGADAREPHAPTCGALTRDGDPCRNPPMSGSTRCRMHGGASPQARRKAALRIAQDEAISLGRARGARRDISPAEALLELVAAKAGEVAYWDDAVAQLDPTDRAADSAEVGVLHRVEDQLSAFSAAALRAGADRAIVAAAAQQASWLVPFALSVAELARTRPDLDGRGVVRLAIESNETAPAATAEAIEQAEDRSIEAQVDMVQDAVLRVFQRLDLSEEQWAIAPGLVVEELEAINEASR